MWWKVLLSPARPLTLEILHQAVSTQDRCLAQSLTTTLENTGERGLFFVTTPLSTLCSWRAALSLLPKPRCDSSSDSSSQAQDRSRPWPPCAHSLSSAPHLPATCTSLCRGLSTARATHQGLGSHSPSEDPRSNPSPGKDGLSLHSKPDNPLWPHQLLTHPPLAKRGEP